MPTMTFTGPYMPRADGALRDWLNNFAAVVARAPEALLLSAAEAAMLVGLAKRYEAAFVRARSPGTRGEPATEEKNAARAEAKGAFRRVAMRIKHNMGIDDSQKIMLGIYPPHRSQSKIPKPRTAPSLALESTHAGVHRLRYSDPASPTRFAKPQNVVHLELRILIGRRPAKKPTGEGRTEFATRHVFNVGFNAADAGRKATYFGRWVTKRGLWGPWSVPVVATIV